MKIVYANATYVNDLKIFTVKFNRTYKAFSGGAYLKRDVFGDQFKASGLVTYHIFKLYARTLGKVQFSGTFTQ